MEPEYTCILEFILRPVNPASSSSWGEESATGPESQSCELQKAPCHSMKALLPSLFLGLQLPFSKQPTLPVSSVSFHTIYAKISTQVFYSFLTNNTLLVFSICLILEIIPHQYISHFFATAQDATVWMNLDLSVSLLLEGHSCGS